MGNFYYIGMLQLDVCAIPEVVQISNFIFKINGSSLSKDKKAYLNYFNGESEIKIKFDLSQLRSHILYHGMENEQFKLNLELIDSKLPEILAFMVLDFHSSNRYKIKDICEHLKKVNPCRFNQSLSHPLYEYKIKHMLHGIALGLQNASLEKVFDINTKEYQIARQDGQVLLRDYYNKNEFLDYLFENTKFETASGSQHDLGTIYTEDGDYYFKLNLQIRFYHQKKKKKKPPQS